MSSASLAPPALAAGVAFADANIAGGAITAPPPAVIGNKAYLSPKDVATILGVSRRTVWAMVARRQLPRPLKISGNLVRWPAAAVAEFLQQLRPST